MKGRRYQPGHVPDIANRPYWCSCGEFVSYDLEAVKAHARNPRPATPLLPSWLVPATPEPEFWRRPYQAHVHRYVCECCGVLHATVCRQGEADYKRQRADERRERRLGAAA